MFGLPYLDAGTCSRPLNLTHQNVFLLWIMCYPLKSDFSVGNILIVKKQFQVRPQTINLVFVSYLLRIKEYGSRLVRAEGMVHVYMLLLVRLKTIIFFLYNEKYFKFENVCFNFYRSNRNERPLAKMWGLNYCNCRHHMHSKKPEEIIYYGKDSFILEVWLFMSQYWTHNIKYRLNTALKYFTKPYKKLFFNLQQRQKDLNLWSYIYRVMQEDIKLKIYTKKKSYRCLMQRIL